MASRMAPRGSASPAMGGRGYRTRVPTGSRSSRKPSPKWTRRGAESVSMITVPGGARWRRRGLTCPLGSGEGDDGPPVLPRHAAQAQVRVGGRGVAHHRQHGQVADAVGVAVEVGREEERDGGVGGGGAGQAAQDPAVVAGEEGEGVDEVGPDQGAVQVVEGRLHGADGKPLASGASTRPGEAAGTSEGALTSA